jgi:hypothetical protein
MFFFYILVSLFLGQPQTHEAYSISKKSRNHWTLISPQISCVSGPQQNSEMLGQSRQKQMNKQVLCGLIPWTVDWSNRGAIMAFCYQKSGQMSTDNPSDPSLVGWPLYQTLSSALTQAVATRPCGTCHVTVFREKRTRPVRITGPDLMANSRSSSNFECDRLCHLQMTQLTHP